MTHAAKSQQGTLHRQKGSLWHSLQPSFYRRWYCLTSCFPPVEGHACWLAPQTVPVPVLHPLGLHHRWLGAPRHRLCRHVPYPGQQLPPTPVQLRVLHLARLREGARLGLVLKVVPGAVACNVFSILHCMYAK